MADYLKGLIDRTITVLTNDGRAIVGVLKGFDNTTNIVLTGCKERVFSKAAGVETVDLGLFIVRGDNIAVIGEVDTESDSAINWDGVTGEPLKPVVQGMQ